MENNNGASKSKKNSRFWQNRRQNRSTSNTNGQDRRPPAAAPNGNPLSLHGMREMFHYVLRCNTTAAAEQQQQDFSPVVLWWHSPAPVVPYDVEESMIAFLVPHQSRERGMFRDQPQHRLRKLEKLCETKPISIRATLSLRRHHMKEFNPYLRPSQLRLGSEELALESATLFEQAVEDFLQQNNVSFYSETEQKAHNAKYQQQGDPSPPTPDFVLKEPITIKQWIQKDGTTNERRILQERSVNWIEVKMFYGASTIRQSSKSAVGSLQAKAKKYVGLYGEGAIVFMHGYGDRLQAMLNNEGVMTLDCSCRESISLECVEAHQRTWCADANGNILP